MFSSRSSNEKHEVGEKMSIKVTMGRLLEKDGGDVKLDVFMNR